ncbi:hypothetical protein Francci3_1757 [Frankia casuarinae]|uniref:Uncharacterized protein n=1 Tax=Frankia casuarinae (strain DSM 45818 / CECT 9043 / HFP020203 / CcI3) TaxID=106370 RepID=Q2JC59_FRACC|nr:hypothetical protein Francci3_1757 [Frankia casuarinae]
MLVAFRAPYAGEFLTAATPAARARETSQQSAPPSPTPYAAPVTRSSRPAGAPTPTDALTHHGFHCGKPGQIANTPKPWARDGTPAVIAHLARVLKPPTIGQFWQLVDQARDESWSHEVYLAAVLQRQVADRAIPRTPSCGSAPPLSPGQDVGGLQPRPSAPAGREPARKRSSP